jgi:hypothetical protein
MYNDFDRDSIKGDRMKTQVVLTGICLTLFVGCSTRNAQPTVSPTLEATATLPAKLEETPIIETSENMITPDLNAVPGGKGWKGYIDVAELIEIEGAAAIEIDNENFNVIWLDGFEFTNGTIEADLKGKSQPPQGSFVGIAFRVMDEITYDAVYFRPFNFGSPNEQSRAHAVQYVSLPEWPWDQLRAEKPGQFEQPVEPAPDGDMWFHVKIEIEENKISVFVNNSEEPVLHVTELSDRSGGSVGLYCYGYGVISNLQITPSN